MFNLIRVFLRFIIFYFALIAPAMSVSIATFSAQSMVSPTDAAYGYEIWEETDYQAAAGPNPLKVVRTYISDEEGNFALGQRWRHNYEIKLEFDDQFAPDGRPLRALLTLGNGDYYQFVYRGTEYFPAVAAPIPTAQLAKLFVIQNVQYPSLITKLHRIGGDFFQS